MGKNLVNNGQYQGDPSAEHVYSAFAKVNQMMSEIYAVLGNGSALAAPGFALPGTQPPATGSYEIGTIMFNSQPTVGGVPGWVVVGPIATPSNWAPWGGSIGGTIIGAPNPYSLAITSPVPVNGAAPQISSVQTLNLQAGAGFLSYAVRDILGNLLVQGVFVNGFAQPQIDTTLLPNGATSVVATAYDALVGAGGQYSAQHSAALTLAVFVVNAVVSIPVSTVPASAFKPTDIPSLVGWYDFGDGLTVTQVSSNVSAVADKTGGAHNGTVPAGHEPAYATGVLSGLAAARFPSTGTKEIVVAAATAVNDIWATGGYMAFIINPKSGGASTVGRVWDKTANAVELNSFGGLFFHQTQNGGTDKYWGTNADAALGFNVSSFVEIGYSRSSTANQPQILVNGNPRKLDVVNQTDGGATLDSDATSPLVFGNTVALDKNYDGDLFALYIFSATPTPAQLVALRTYVQSRWPAITINVGTALPTPAPAPAPAPTPTPSGVVLKTSAFVGGDSSIETSMVAFETFIGHTGLTALQFGGAASQADLTGSTNFEFSLSPNTRLLHYTQPLIGGGMNLAAAAAGSYNSLYDTIVANLLAAFNRGQWKQIRLSQEFNGNWFAANIHSTSAAGGMGGTPAQYAAAFRIFALKLLAAVPTALIEWCPNWGQTDPTGAWPGDDVVQICGIDLYENPTYMNGDGPSRWAQFLSQPLNNGVVTWDLTQHAAFAALHGKPMAVTEYGSGFNDGYFYTQLAAWMRARNVIRHGIWDSTSSFNSYLPNFPVAQAAYYSLWH